MTYGSLSIFKEFAEIAKSYSSKPAIFFKEGPQFKSTSYGELYELTVRIADLLYSKGLRQGEKAALIIPNQPQWPMCFLAAQSIGAICVPIDINLTAQEMSKLIVHSDAKIVLCPKRIYEALMDFARAEGKPEFILTDAPEFFEIASPLTSKMSRARNDGQEIAAIIYTSGTTDLPKGVMLTQKNLLSNFDSIKKLNITDSEDVFISVLPLHHTYSFMVTCLLPLLEGASISYPASLLNPEEILTCIRETKVNILTGVPQLFSLFHRRIKARINGIPAVARLFINLLKEMFWLIRKIFKINLNRRLFFRLHRAIGPSLEFMISGGAHLDEVMAKDFFKWGFTILEGYGLTETSPIAAFNTPENYRIGSVGRALPDVQIRIINPDECGLGEVALKGPNVMTGYYKLPEETTKALRDGWFFTGDEGYLDKKGYLYVKSRKDEMIVLTSGKKVNPEEIEKHYSLSPCIKELCVFAPQGPAGKTVKQLMAVVVPDEKYFHERYQVNIEEKIKWELDNLSYRLSAYKRIKGFVISKDALPRTALGKLMRYEIQDIYARGSSYSVKKREEPVEEDAGLFSSETYRATLKYLSNRFKREIGLNDHLELDLGLDSLGRIEFLMDLEQFLKIQIPEDKALELFSASTIKELILKAKAILPPGEFTQPKEPEFLWVDVLRQPPPGRMLDIINLRPSIVDKMASFLVIGGLKIFFGVFFLLKVKGKDNFPRKGPCIIYVNHTSYLDGLIIAASIPFRLAITTYYVGFREVFLHPILKNMTRVARLVPMDAMIDLIEALQTCAFLLKNSKIICYFPEGGRSPDGEIIRFKKGIGILAKELNTPLLPVYIEGASRILSRRVKFLKPTKLNITVGKEITSLSAGAKDDSYEVVSENLRRELIQLKPNLN